MPGKRRFVARRSLVLLVPATVLAAMSVMPPHAAIASGPSVVWDSQSSTYPYGTTPPPGGDQGAVQPNTEIEPSVAVNPGDPNDVVTVFQVGRVDAGGDADNGFATTLNGLTASPTWTSANLPGLTKGAPGTPATTLCAATLPPTSGPFDRASDAVVTFGRAATGQPNYHGYIAYANSLVFDDSTCSAFPSGMAINQSTDGGKTWTNALVIQSDNFAGLNDKNWIVVDNRPGALHPGRVYVFWDKVVAGLAYTYCDPVGTTLTGVGCDKLANWTTLQLVGGQSFGTSLTQTPAIGVFPVVLKDGSLGFVFNDEEGTGTCTGTNPTDNACLLSGTSLAWDILPGADTVPWPTLLPNIPNHWVDITPYDSNGVTKQRAGSLPQAAVDPITNEVYITWEDNRFRGTSSKNQNDAVIAYATDPGTGLPGMTAASWTGPIRVDPEAASSLVNDYNPTIAIGADSILRVAYRSRSEAAPFNPSTGLGTPIDTYYQEAATGATTSSSFSAPLKVDVTQNTPDAQFGAFSRGGLFQGDYDQITAAGTDQSYITRDEAWPLPGEASCNTTDFTALPTTPCQNQQTWVALIAPSGSEGALPEGRWPGLFVVAAAGAGALLLARRRRQRVTR